MDSTVHFEKIIEAFLHASQDDFCFLSAGELIKKSGMTKEDAQKTAGPGSVLIPRRTAEFDKRVKEEFVYEIADPKVAEIFFEATTHTSPIKSFEQLLAEHSLEPSWQAHQKKFASNALINWILRSGIELPGQALAPSVGVSAAESVPEEMKTFIPTVCNSCGNTTGFKVSYFKTSRLCENLLMEKKAGDEMKKHGYEEFHFLGKARKELIAASACPSCKSQDLAWEFA